jgi:hypothetical protein
LRELSFDYLLELEKRELAVAISDAAASHVVGRDLNLDLVTGEDADAVHAHFPRTVCEDGVPVLQLDTEHGVRQWLDDGSLYGERIFLRLTQVLSPCIFTAGRAGAKLPHEIDLKGLPRGRLSILPDNLKNAKTPALSRRFDLATS